jgi:hypothetical protein
MIEHPSIVMVRNFVTQSDAKEAAESLRGTAPRSFVAPVALRAFGRGAIRPPASPLNLNPRNP